MPMLNLASVGLTASGLLVVGATLRWVRPKSVKALLLVFGVSMAAVGLGLLMDLLTLSV